MWENSLKEKLPDLFSRYLTSGDVGSYLGKQLDDIVYFSIALCVLSFKFGINKSSMLNSSSFSETVAEF